MLARVFGKEFEGVAGAGAPAPKTPEQLSWARVQNPHEPEATYAVEGQGQKEPVGYKVQVAETVSQGRLAPGEPTQNFITGVVTHPAYESDEAGAVKIEAEPAGRGLEKPPVQYVDAAHISAQQLVHKERLKHRNGIEGTQSERVRAHGWRRARYRGLAKTRLQNDFIGAACNVKRWLRREAWQRQQALSLDRAQLAGATAHQALGSDEGFLNAANNWLTGAALSVDSPAPMNRFTKVIRGGLALFLGLAPLSCTQQKTPAGGPPRDPLAVTLAPVVAQKLERVVTVSGTLLAPDQSPLSVKVPGRVRSIAVDLGSRVQTGDLLAEIDPQDYQLRLNQAKAALAQARARVGLTLDGDDDAVDLERTPTVKQARAVLQEKQKDLDRQHALSTQGIASQAELEVAQAAYEVAINKYEDGLEEVKNRVAVLAQRRAEHDIARQQLSDTRLLAPFDGAIQDRTANVGQYLPVGTQVVKLVRTDPLRLRAEVSERDAPRIQLGQPVRLQVEGFEQGFTGRVGRLSPAITERSRMLILEADIPSQGVLRPGAFARVQVVTADATPALTVPTNALVVFAGLEKVFVARDGVADERVITTGDRAGDRVEVLTGVREGEAVVLNPGGLQTGRKLLVPPPEPAPPGRP